MTDPMTLPDPDDAPTADLPLDPSDESAVEAIADAAIETVATPTETEPVAEAVEEPAEVEPEPVVEPTPIPAASGEVAAPEVAEAEPVAAEPVAAEVEPVPEEEPEPVSPKKWYILKVTSGREESIKAAIERKVKIEGLEEFFGQVHIPVERVMVVKKVKETRNGETTTKEKRVTKATKKYPGYLMAEVEYCDAIQILFRETSGVGDFVTGGLGRIPTPMEDIDVQRMLGDSMPAEEGKKGKRGGKTIVKLDYEKGDKVRAREGAFANMEGEVKEITIPKDSSETPKVSVEVTIFGRPVMIELEHWQVDKI